MVGDLLIVHILCPSDLLPGSAVQRLRGKVRERPEIPESADILIDLLRHRSGENSGVCSRVSHQLFLIEFLDDL